MIKKKEKTKFHKDQGNKEKKTPGINHPLHLGLCISSVTFACTVLYVYVLRQQGSIPIPFIEF